MGVVDEEPDAFAGADGAQAFGDDVGVIEGVGNAGLLITDDVGAVLAAGCGRGRLAAGDEAGERLRPVLEAQVEIEPVPPGTRPVRGGDKLFEQGRLPAAEPATISRLPPPPPGGAAARARPRRRTPPSRPTAHPR